MNAHYYIPIKHKDLSKNSGHPYKTGIQTGPQDRALCLTKSPSIKTLFQRQRQEPNEHHFYKNAAVDLCQIIALTYS